MNFKLIMGYKCNLNCSYCYQKAEHCSDKDISYEVLDKFIERFNKLEGIHTINFFGGEPLLYKDKIKYVLERIDKKHEISLSTNGTLRKEFYELQSYWGKPFFNLLSNKKHKNYNRLNSYSSFRFVVTHSNLIELNDELIEFLAYEYGDKLSFKYDLTHKWTISEIFFLEEVEKKFKKILGFQFNMELPVNVNTCFKCLANNHCCIDSNGNYLQCHRVPNSVVGNIFEDDFIASKIGDCLERKSINEANLFSYGNYKFKGTTLFCGCD